MRSLLRIWARKGCPAVVAFSPMESVFKKKLQDLKNPGAHKSFSQDLYGHVPWSLDMPEAPQVVAPAKVEIIEKFTEFAKESLQNSENEKIVFPGGEVVKKTSPHDFETPVLTLDALKEKISALIPTQDLQARYADKVRVKVIFVSEKIMPAGLTLSPDAGDLFAKMVKAMKLGNSDFLMSAIKLETPSGEKDFLKELMMEIATFRPELIITLGAEAAMKLLGTRERLGELHGKFSPFEVKGSSESFQLMPLFHPELLLINPNMKKTAWEDMQKAMKFLGL